VSLSQVGSARRFRGAARVYGDAGAARIGAAHVCVIGTGGVGSWTVEALARSGVGALTLIDPDHVAESNINRQLHALGSTLGRAKVGVLAERVEDINPGCRVHVLEEFLALDNLHRLLGADPGYVVDCIDNARVKAGLIAYSHRRRLRLVTVGGAGGQVDPTRIRVSDLARSAQDPLLARVRRLLRQDYGFNRNPKRRFGVPCVWSDEPMVLPGEGGGVCLQRPAARETRDLSCAGGIGSVVTVTATFGLVAAAHVLGRLASQASAVPQSEKPTSAWLPSQ